MTRDLLYRLEQDKNAIGELHSFAQYVKEKSDAQAAPGGKHH
jgi:hypothetical protein